MHGGAFFDVAARKIAARRPIAVFAPVSAVALDVERD